MKAARAYQDSSRHRTVKVQEAEVFLRVNAALRQASCGSPLARAKALADNELLWLTVMDVLRDPANALPVPLRASVISLGLAVQREQRKTEPDFAFLTGINEQLAAGLSGH